MESLDPLLLLIPILVLGCAGSPPPAGVPDFEARFRASCGPSATTESCRALAREGDALQRRCATMNDDADCAVPRRQAERATESVLRLKARDDGDTGPKHLTGRMLESADRGAPDAEKGLRVFTAKRERWLSGAKTRCGTELSSVVCNKPPPDITVGGPTGDDVDECRRLCAPEIAASLDRFFTDTERACVSAFVEGEGEGHFACDEELPVTADAPEDLVQRRAECGKQCVADGKKRLGRAGGRGTAK